MDRSFRRRGSPQDRRRTRRECRLVVAPLHGRGAIWESRLRAGRTRSRVLVCLLSPATAGGPPGGGGGGRGVAKIYTRFTAGTWALGTAGAGQWSRTIATHDTGLKHVVCVTRRGHAGTHTQSWRCGGASFVVVWLRQILRMGKRETERSGDCSNTEAREVLNSP